MIYPVAVVLAVIAINRSLGLSTALHLIAPSLESTGRPAPFGNHVGLIFLPKKKICYVQRVANRDLST